MQRYVQCHTAQNVRRQRRWAAGLEHEKPLEDPQGASFDDSTIAATITRDAWSLRRGLEAKIQGRQASDFSLRAKKIMAFRNQEYEVLYRGSVIGQVRLTGSAPSAIVPKYANAQPLPGIDCDALLHKLGCKA